MTRLTWNDPGSRLFEAGVDRGVLYVGSDPGVAWDGLIAVAESPSGGEPQPFYMDGIRHQNRPSNEEFSGKLEAYSYPPEFGVCDGTMEVSQGLIAKYQRRKPFGLTYRTLIGNDINGIDFGYKIHIIYNAMASPTEYANNSLGEQVEPTSFSWALTAVPTRVDGMKPTSHFIIDSTKTKPAVLAAIEALLYGSAANQPYLPPPLELISMYVSAEPDAPFTVTYLGNDVYEISGSDSAVKMLDSTHFQLNSSSVIDNFDGSYTATTSVQDNPDGPVLLFTVTALGNDLYSISGPDSMVRMTDANHYELISPFVIDNGDGSFTATSAE